MSFLAYRTRRMMRVDIWQLGLAHRLLQLVIVGYVSYEIIIDHTWAYGETPVGRFNIYGNWTAQYAAVLGTSPSYCDNPSHDYVYGGIWSYIMPSCRALEIEEFVTKGIGAITVTTSIVETVQIAWPCADATVDAEKRASCEELGAAVVESGAQCGCDASQVYYVKGVEAVGVAFEHGYRTTDRISGGLSGSSADPYGTLDTTVTFPNGSEAVYAAGAAVVLSLQELISLNDQGCSLDLSNFVVQDDARGNGFKPKFRATGMKLTVDVQYSNLKARGFAGRDVAPLSNSDVDASVSVTAEAGWAGAGPQVFYLSGPRHAADGTQRFEKMTRYRQGIEIVFRPAGLVYAFDYPHFIACVLAAYLYLKLAALLIDFVAFNLLPHGMSTVLQHKRAERVSKVHSFAQLGLRAAVAVRGFHALDPSGQGFIELKELVSVFGSIPQVSKEQALLIAQTIMRAADTDTDLKGRLTFNEFMSLFEGETALDFDSYVKLVHTTATRYKLEHGEAEAAREAYDAVEAGVDLREGAHAAAKPPKRGSKVGPEPAPAADGAGEAGGAPGGAWAAGGGAHGTPHADVARLTCFLCQLVFGVPAGARLVRCPQCQTVNSTDARPAPARAPSGLLGMFSSISRPPAAPHAMGAPPGPPPGSHGVTYVQPFAQQPAPPLPPQPPPQQLQLQHEPPPLVPPQQSVPLQTTLY